MNGNLGSCANGCAKGIWQRQFMTSVLNTEAHIDGNDRVTVPVGTKEPIRRRCGNESLRTRRIRNFSSSDPDKQCFQLGLSG